MDMESVNGKNIFRNDNSQVDCYRFFTEDNIVKIIRSPFDELMNYEYYETKAYFVIVLNFRHLSINYFK